QRPTSSVTSSRPGWTSKPRSDASGSPNRPRTSEAAGIAGKPHSTSGARQPGRARSTGSFSHRGITPMTDIITTLERIDARLRAKRPAAPTIRTAFADFLVALAETPPAQIMGDCDADDLDHLSEHMQQVMTAVE